MWLTFAVLQYQRMIANRKDDIGLNVAACDTYQDVHFVDTGTTAGIVEFMSESFKNEWHKDMNSAALELIPCMPLSAIRLRQVKQHQAPSSSPLRPFQRVSPS